MHASLGERVSISLEAFFLIVFLHMFSIGEGLLSERKFSRGSDSLAIEVSRERGSLKALMILTVSWGEMSSLQEISDIESSSPLFLKDFFGCFFYFVKFLVNIYRNSDNPAFFFDGSVYCFFYPP